MVFSFYYLFTSIHRASLPICFLSFFSLSDSCFSFPFFLCTQIPAGFSLLFPPCTHDTKCTRNTLALNAASFLLLLHSSRQTQTKSISSLFLTASLFAKLSLIICRKIIHVSIHSSLLCVVTSPHSFTNYVDGGERERDK